MDLRTNEFLKSIYTKFLCSSNVNLVNRMVRRRVSKLSEGKYRPSETESHFKNLKEKMRDYIRIHIEYLTGSNSDILTTLNIQFSKKMSKLMWNSYQDEMVFFNNQERENYIIDIPKPSTEEEELINPLCQQELGDSPCFEKRPNFWD